MVDSGLIIFALSVLGATAAWALKFHSDWVSHKDKLKDAKDDLNKAFDRIRQLEIELATFKQQQQRIDAVQDRKVMAMLSELDSRLTHFVGKHGGTYTGGTPPEKLFDDIE